MRLNIKGHVSFICSKTHHEIKQYVLSLLVIGYVKPILAGKEMCNAVLEVSWVRPRDKLIHVLCVCWD